MSEHCEQTIVNNCTTSALTGYSFWTARSGLNVTYWNGDKDYEAEGCACKDDNSCMERYVDYVLIKPMYNLSNLPGYDLICNCDSKEPGAIDVGVLTSKDQLPVTSLNYGDDNYRYQWKKYELGNLVCGGKSRSLPSEGKNEDRYLELKNEIGEVKDDLSDAKTNLDDLQERNYAFKYYVSTSVWTDAVKKGTIVNFDSQDYGSGVSNGQYSAPIGNNFIYSSEIDIHN